MFWRLQFATLIVVLLCVPALTRASQRLDPIAPSPQAVGLSRNCEVPPQRVVLTGPQTTSDFLAEAADADTAAIAPERVPFARTAGDEQLLVFLPSSPPDSLRAPPAPRS
jgi:hypothetical protein